MARWVSGTHAGPQASRACPGRAGSWGQGPYHVLVVEQVHHAGRPLAHGHQVGRGLVEPQQAQGRALLHAVHAVPVGTQSGVGVGVSATPALHTALLLSHSSQEGCPARGGKSLVDPGTHLVLPSRPTGPPILPLQNGLHLSNLMRSQAGQAWLCTFTQLPSAHLSTAWAPATRRHCGLRVRAQQLSRV